MTRSQLTTLALAMLALAAVPALIETVSRPAWGPARQSRERIVKPFAAWKAYTMPKDSPRSTQSFTVAKTDEEWQVSLTPRQYGVLRQHDTEYPGTSPLLEEHRDGTFVCAGCGQPLFSSGTKYESGSGWPSFYAAVEGAISTTEDRTLGMTRVEIHCSRCGGHLGHVFPDGPRPTGQRYCTNGAALRFEPNE